MAEQTTSSIVIDAPPAAVMAAIADFESYPSWAKGVTTADVTVPDLAGYLDAGLPADVYAANKAGWLYEVYDDVGIVKAGDRPYVIAILSKYGSGDVDQGSVLIEDLSRIAWESQNGGEDGS